MVNTLQLGMTLMPFSRQTQFSIRAGLGSAFVRLQKTGST